MNMGEQKSFDLEAFMKSITYMPEGMSAFLARKEFKDSGEVLPPPKREMAILRRSLMLLPIGIGKEDLIAGNYGAKFADDAFLQRCRKADEAEFEHSDEYKVNSEDERIVSGNYMMFGIYTPSHTCADYGSIVNRGLKGYEEQIRQRLSENPDETGKIYLEAMLDGIRAALDFADRYRNLALKLMEENTEDSAFVSRLKRMADALSKVPYEPAGNLFEALQSIWIVHTVMPASERSWASVTLGKMDEYLLPMYEKWLKDGGTPEEAEELFAAFFLLQDSYGDGSGAMNFGHPWNKLSELLLRVEKRVRYRAPIVAVRMDEDTPGHIWEELVDKTLFEIGQPTFYGEKPCEKAMEYRGQGHKDFSVNSCMGMVTVGEELADMWGCCVNMNLPLELAVNHGKPLRGELPASLGSYMDQVCPVKPDSMEWIKAAYYEYLQQAVNYVADQNRERAAWAALNRPNAFYSMLLDDCIGCARDRAYGAVAELGAKKARLLMEDQPSADMEGLAEGHGAKFHNVTVLAMGFAHAADALSAIDKLVFRDKIYTLTQLIEAQRANFRGSDAAIQLSGELARCPKYALGDAEADDNAIFVLNALADACEKRKGTYISYLPSCHTIDANVQFGNCVYATLDGRRDGEPFGKNAGPVMGAIKNTPVDLMLSASRLPQHRFSGGVPIDIYVPENLLESEELRRKLNTLLKTYIGMGGMQIQVNSVNLELLKKAYAEPELYPGVIVRKGGFSLYFTDMLKEVQKDMIDRFEKETKGS